MQAKSSKKSGLGGKKIIKKPLKNKGKAKDSENEDFDIQ